MCTIKISDINDIVRTCLSRFKDNDIVFRVCEDNEYSKPVITYGDLFNMINIYKTPKQMASYIARIYRAYFRKYIKHDSINFYLYLISGIADKINEDIRSINNIRDDALMLDAAISCHDNIAKSKYAKRRIAKTFGDDSELINYFDHKIINLKYYERYDEKIENKLDERIIEIAEAMRKVYDEEYKKLNDLKEKLLEIIKCCECFEIEVNVEIGWYRKKQFTTDTIYKGLITRKCRRTSNMYYVYPIIQDTNRRLTIYSHPTKGTAVLFFHSKDPIDFKNKDRLYVSIS